VDKRFERENYLGLYAWVAFVALCLLLYFLNPDVFTPENIRGWFGDNLYLGLFIYVALFCIRAFTFIPHTPLLVAAILVFPPLPLFFANLCGINGTIAIIYFLSRKLRFDRYFDTHYPEQIAKLSRLLHKWEFPVIMFWSFALVLPTDVIVYVCSILRIKPIKAFVGVSLGEGFISAIYIFAGAAGVDWLLGT
jgi:uncharacterized membrane protein YdjX (TVP38/TMEM64 family)